MSREKPWHLPTHDECENVVRWHTSESTALERFIFEHEPVEADEFRDDLAAAIAECVATGRGRLSAERDRLAAELEVARRVIDEAGLVMREIYGADRCKDCGYLFRESEHIGCVRRQKAAPAPAAVPKAEPFLQFNLTQALALVESFGGIDGDMAVSWFDKAADDEGEPMPSGLYAYCYDYPEEGRQWLGDPLAEIEAGSAPAAVPSTTEETIRTATQYAHDLVVSLHRDHYQDNNAFEPFDDLLGLLSQIDNMICGWKEPAAVPDSEPEWPEYHHEGMGCGIEDRGITDRYEACRYGFEDAVERCAVAFDNWRATSTVPSAVPYGVVLPDHEPTIAIGEILDGYDGEELDDVWESIKAYADVHARSALEAAGIPALNEAPSLWVAFSDSGANIRMWSAEGPEKITDAGLTPIQFVLAAAQKGGE